MTFPSDYLDFYTQTLDDRPIVMVESPYSGDVENNLHYLRRAMRDCIFRGEIPFATHAFGPQFLDDTIPGERELGIVLGQYLIEPDFIAFYLDRGWSHGMREAECYYKELSFPTEYRKIES